MIDGTLYWPDKYEFDWYETYRSSWANSFPKWIGEAIRLNQGSGMGLRLMPRQKPVRIRLIGEWNRTNRGCTVAV